MNANNFFDKSNAGIHLLKQLSFVCFIIAIPLRFHATIMIRPNPPIYREYTDMMIYASDFFLLSTLTLWFIELNRERRKITLEPNFLSYALILLTFISMISTLFSVDPQLSAYHSVRMLLLFLLYVFLINNPSIRKLFLPISIMLLISAIPGIIQFQLQGSIGLFSLGELPLDPSTPGISIVNHEEVRYLRAYGLTDHPNILGGSIALALLLLSYIKVDEDYSIRSLQSGVFSIGVLGLLFTFSRSAWIAFILSSLLALFWLMKSNAAEEIRKLVWLYIPASMILLPFLWVNLPLLEVRLNTGGSINGNPQEIQSIGERGLMNKTANELFINHPFTGVGLGTLPIAIKEVYPDFPVAYQPAHFVLLDVAAETGIFGALAYSILIITPWLLMFQHRERLTISSMLIGSSCALLAIIVLGMFDYYPWLLTPGRYWQWFLFGLWANSFQNSRFKDG